MIWANHNTLWIDIETKSSVDIKSSGSYKYAMSDDFEILLFAYAYDNEPVVTVDLACGEEIPESVVKDLLNPSVTKHAYNAQFEWWCLNRAGYETDLEQWQCTMIHSLYCGYCGSLEATGKAIGLPEDKQKLAVGKRLIRYFSVPCKPSKANGGRTWNLPVHDPEKWKLYKTYNIQDVETEREIARILEPFPVPEDEWHLWRLDVRMNAYGVRVDKDLMSGAIEIDRMSREELEAEAKWITGLDNPNSVQQLLGWLDSKGITVTSIAKEAVADLLATDLPKDVRRLLEIRQMLGKTSVKKYQAMFDCKCDDDRIRGVSQFYGANRTGRYCLTGDHEVLTPDGWIRIDRWKGGPICCYDIEKGMLVGCLESQAVKFDYEGDMVHIKSTMVDQISTPDHKMAIKRYPVAKRMLAATAEEVMNRTQTGIPVPVSWPRGRTTMHWIQKSHPAVKLEKIPFSGKVYCAVTPTGYFLTRRKGHFWVTGNSGRLVQLQNMTKNHIDTIDTARKLIKERNYAALKMIYGNVQDILSQMVRTAFIPSEGRHFVVADFSAIEARVIAWLAGEEWANEEFAGEGKIYEATAAQMFKVPKDRIKKGNPEYALRQKGKQATLACGYGGGSGAMINMGALKLGLTEEELPDLVKKWRDANPNIVKFWSKVGKAAEDAVEYASSRTVQVKYKDEAYLEELKKQYGSLPPGMNPYRNVPGGLTFAIEGTKDHTYLTIDLFGRRKLFYVEPRLDLNRYGKNELFYHQQDQMTRQWGEAHSFGGKIAENLCQSVARDCLCEILKRIEALGMQVVFHVHDEVIIDAPLDVTADDICDIMAQPIDWAPGLVLRGAGFESAYYMKD